MKQMSKAGTSTTALRKKFIYLSPPNSTLHIVNPLYNIFINILKRYKVLLYKDPSIKQLRIDVYPYTFNVLKI